MPNIKLQSIPAFFPDARADAHEKSGYGCNFFSLGVTAKKTRKQFIDYYQDMENDKCENISYIN